MPIYTITSYEQNIPRNTIILDTNVLVAAFCPRDSIHEDARLFVDECSEPLAVPIAVLIETWGMIVGSYKYRKGGLELLAWLNTPGNAELLPQVVTRFDIESNVIQSNYIDCVDVFVSHLADDISRLCQLRPYVTVATYDTADMVRCRMKKDLQLKILDLRSWEEC